jgi:hypothetical protein
LSRLAIAQVKLLVTSCPFLDVVVEMVEGEGAVEGGLPSSALRAARRTGLAGRVAITGTRCSI